jgi:AbrB family looped-hinge helix DNA binding protein
METAVVTTRGRLVIPVQIRRRLGLKQGVRVRIFERGGEILLLPVTAIAVRRLCGVLKSRRSVTGQLLVERRRDRRRTTRAASL